MYGVQVHIIDTLASERTDLRIKNVTANINSNILV